MADSRKAPPLPNPTVRSQSRHSRRVLFSDLPPKCNQNRSTIPLDNEKNCRPCCLSLCAWLCLSVFALVLFVLLLGVLVASFLHTALPEIAVRGLEVQKPNSGNTADTIELVLEFSNQNEKIAVSFGALTVAAASERVGLGKTWIGAFSQGPRSTTELRVSTAAESAGEDVEESVTDLNNSEAVLEVTIRGNVGFHLGRIDVDGVPLLISCNPLKSEVDRGNKSLCGARIFPL